MPAAITHHLFGQDVMEHFGPACGDTLEEVHAFELGNQGPDPLFFLIASPTVGDLRKLGSLMHSEQPAELLAAFKAALGILDEDELPIGRAYAHGFLCHYVLDSHEHPLIYAQQHALCDAGIDGLTREDGREVHAMIECELDELALYTLKGKTIAQFNPTRELLRADTRTLAIVQKLYAYAFLATYGRVIPHDLFATAVAYHRLAWRAFYSPHGFKRTVLATFEELVRPYSILQAMAPKPIERTTSWFANDEHRSWENPHTHVQSSDSFWGIYNTAKLEAMNLIDQFDQRSFDISRAQAITADINFSGAPTGAVLLESE